jgi:uncharacterized membrane protein (DUF485 family)
MLFGAINFVAVAVCVVVALVVGALWHSPFLFGHLWMRAYGYTPEQMKTVARRTVPAYVVSAFGYFLMALVLSVLVIWTAADNLDRGLGLGFMVWVGFVANTGLIWNRFSDKPLAAWLIDSAFELVYLLFMGAVLAVWV